MRNPLGLLGLAALAIAATPACKDPASTTSTTTADRDQGAIGTTKTADNNGTQDSLKAARDANKEAAKNQDDALKAQQDLNKDQNKLATAQMKADAAARQAQDRVQTAQQAAQSDTAKADATAKTSDTAATSDTMAKTADSKAATDSMAKSDDLGKRDAAASSASAAQQMATGKLASASGDQLLISSPERPDLKLKVDPTTNITLDGQKASAAQLPEGSQVRAAYHLVDDKPVALTIDVTSSKTLDNGTPSDKGAATPDTSKDSQPAAH